jgi:hypothetical protein
MLLKNLAASLRRSFFTVFVDMTTASLLWHPDTDGRFASAEGRKEGGRHLACLARSGYLSAPIRHLTGSNAADLIG